MHYCVHHVNSSGAGYARCAFRLSWGTALGGGVRKVHVARGLPSPYCSPKAARAHVIIVKYVLSPVAVALPPSTASKVVEQGFQRRGTGCRPISIDWHVAPGV
jgi:hypothetical protein